MENEEKEKDNNIKKHLDTAWIILSIIISVLSGVMWINSRFNDLQKDLVMIKTVLIMKNIMPSDLAKCDKEKQ